MYVRDRAFNESAVWNKKERKMFDHYIERFMCEIRDIFGIADLNSDSDEQKRRKDKQFKSIVDKLKHIMEKRHYVSSICSQNRAYGVL